MKKINFNFDNYQFFNDYKNIMVEAFQIGCSLCQSPDITYVIKKSPTPIGKLIKEQGQNLTDDQVQELIEKPIQAWQEFDDENSINQIPTFLCDECINTLNEND